ncbi:MAG: hypothetical protein ACR2MM_05215 [Flavobacteriaceae bacterium]
MKKIILIISIFCAFVYLGSCTNDEGGSDLDVVTPDDTIVAVSIN